MSAPVPLHFTRITPKVPVASLVGQLSGVSPATVSPKRVSFFLLHGFLAHSGSLNSLVTNLRKGLDKRNEGVIAALSSTSRGAAATNGTSRSTFTHPIPQGVASLTDYEIISLDARNHGLSPHTATHLLPDLVADFGHFLNQHQRERTDTHGHAAPALKVAIGHSMGSGTAAYYLMRRQAALRQGLLTAESHPHHGGKGFSDFDVGTVPLDPSLFAEALDAFVSIDMPPITGAEMSDKLHDELMAMLLEMEKVDLANIKDMRSAHDEFLRCGMTDPRTRGLCSTNLLLARDRQRHAHEDGGDSSLPTRWKCNLPTLRRSLERYQLFFPDGFTRHPEDFSYPLERPPVLSLLGGDSPIGGKERFQQTWPRFAERLHQHVVPGATHTVFFDKPEDTARHIFDFLESTGIVETPTM